MTYLGFHLRFNGLFLATLILLNLGTSWTAAEAPAWGLVLFAVMVFTSPWDNWAVAKGIWGFPRERFSLQIGWLPIEEYAFFVIQTVNVMLSTRLLLHLFPQIRSHVVTEFSLANVSVTGGFLIGWAMLWFWVKRLPLRFQYTRHLLYWFMPVIILQWFLAGSLFLSHAALIFGITFFWGSYYTWADWKAVKAGVWHFDEKQITGIKWRRILPIEEIAFFYLTSWLVTQSYLMLLSPVLR